LAVPDSPDKESTMEAKDIEQVDYRQPVQMKDGRIGKLRGAPGPDGLFVIDFADGGVQKIHFSRLRILLDQGGRLAEP
jgi:hypothetical protein